MTDPAALDITDWADCPDCGQHKVNMWAGEGLCSPCTKARIGGAEFERRYAATRAVDGSWAGPEASLKAIEDSDA
jgi:hypothetical protein